MPTPAPPDAATSPPWANLLPDLLREISGRVGTAANYVRFHAVCWSWRETVADRRPALLPWLLSPRDTAGNRKARRIFSSSKSSLYGAAATEICLPDRRWVTSGRDGTATCWLQANSNSESSGLVVGCPTGSAAAIPLPRYTDEMEMWEERAIGVASGDGTIAVYAYGTTHTHGCNRVDHGFVVALRHPGEAEWTLVQKNNTRFDETWHRHSCLAYWNGKIILFCGQSWCIRSTQGEAGNWQWTSMRREPGKVFQRSYLVEFDGQLLCVFVQLKAEPAESAHNTGENLNPTFRATTVDGLAGALSLSVYVFQDAEGGKPRWVKWDGRSLAEHVLFLGRPGSFAVPAARFGMSGRGCAYFVDKREVWSDSPLMRCRVFKYSFHDGSTELVEQLPEDWNDEACTWLTPQPVIAQSVKTNLNL